MSDSSVSGARQRKHRGFTLAELAVTTIVVGILAEAVLPRFAAGLSLVAAIFLLTILAALGAFIATVLCTAHANQGHGPTVYEIMSTAGKQPLAGYQPDGRSMPEPGAGIQFNSEEREMQVPFRVPRERR